MILFVYSGGNNNKLSLPQISKIIQTATANPTYYYPSFISRDTINAATIEICFIFLVSFLLMALLVPL